jgi:hypothetical protein
MKKGNTGRFFNLSAVFTCAVSVIVLLMACSNPIIEKWWGDPENVLNPPITEDQPYHVVSFNMQGGSPFVVAQLIAHGGRIAKVPDITKPHSSFEGWFPNVNSTGAAWDFSKDTVNQDITLFASWRPDPIVVRFDPNGGKPAPDPQTLMNGTHVQEPLAMTHDDEYGFGGWFVGDETGSSYTESWLFNIPVSKEYSSISANGEVLLYAKWDGNFHTVTFVGDGDPFPEPQRIADGGKVVEPLPVGLDHYVFAGWFTDPKFTDRWDFSARKVYKDETLYIKWEGAIYTVTFITNGGSPQPIEQQIVWQGPWNLQR